MPMTTVCKGCAHEQACGHAEVHACANREPVAWCSRGALDDAVKQREHYRDRALFLACQFRQAIGCTACRACERGIRSYCDDVIEEVDE